MNLNGISKKLQRAILQTGLIIKFSSRQFYSQEQKRLINMYSVSTPVMGRNKYGDWKEKDLERYMESGEMMEDREELEKKMAELYSELAKRNEEIKYLRKENENVKSAAEMYRREAESYQQQCIEINRLNTALDVLVGKYARLMHTAGRDQP